MYFHAIKCHFTKTTISGLQAAELMLRNVFFWMCLTEVNCLQEAKSSFLYNLNHFSGASYDQTSQKVNQYNIDICSFV